jgi:type II secretory ATPase GspE/PulE/Tfp pilus assembly ATPase PilB-like protein
MRQRFVIWFVLPCLCLAWPSIPKVCAQISPLVLPADPETAAVRRDVKLAKEVAAAKANPQQPGTENAAPAEAAAPAAPAQNLDKYNDAHSNAMRQFKKGFIAWPKLVAILLLILIWVKSCDWINQDTQIFNLGYGKWNPIQLFPFLAILLLFAFPILVGVANFWVAFGLLFVCYLACFIPYVLLRNKAVQLHEKVFTPDWFRYEFAHLAGKVGIKMEAERKAEYEKGANVDLMAIGSADERENQANLITARQSPGYILVKEVVADMVDRRSDRVILDYTQEAVVSRHHIDGVWHNGEARDRESGDVMLAVMKTLANLSATERRKKQAGKFAAKYNGHSFMCPLSSQGVPTGERVVLQLLGGYQQTFKKFDDLGMRSKLAEQWANLITTDKGVLVIAGVPEGGVTTLTDVSLLETDRLLRDFVSIEEVNHRERELENIEVTTYDASKGESAATVLPSLIRKYPNVYVLRDLSDVEAAKLLFNEVRDDDRLLITNVHAKSAPEALLRMLQLKVPHKEFATLVTAVLCTRLIRKLCDACKVGYAPTPDLLKKLGIPAGKIEALYRSPKPEEVEKPCKECGGLGFKGRTAIFELLEVDDKMREVLLKKPQLDLAKKVARAAGMRPFQEEGLLLVAKGLTSLAELQRVLKE